MTDTNATISTTTTPDAGDSHPRSRVQATFGSLAIFFGVAIVILAAVDSTSAIDFMPISWHANRALWYLMAFASFLGGAALLWSQRERSDGITQSAPRFERVVLYTRQRCHLCHDAKTALAEFHDVLPPIEEIDVDTDPRLKERFDTCVPVVEFDGKVRFRGKISPVLLRRFISMSGET